MILRVVYLIFIVLASVYLAFLFGSASLLPDRVASHFGVNGHANGWMTRSGYLSFMAALGICMPLFLVAICFLSRFLPASMVNVPNGDYWLAPERRPQAQAELTNLSCWLACLMVSFFGALHYLVLHANHSAQLRLPMALFGTLVTLFLLILGVWIIALYRRFPRVR